MDIKNDSKLISLFGYWPQFCDAKITFFSSTKNRNEGRVISVILSYIDADKSVGADVELFFSGVTQLDMSDFTDENVLDELIISEVSGSGLQLVQFFSCCGLSGDFNCEIVEVRELIEFKV